MADGKISPEQITEQVHDLSSGIPPDTASAFDIVTMFSGMTQLDASDISDACVDLKLPPDMVARIDSTKGLIDYDVVE